MKKWFIIALLLVLLSGCSWDKFMKWYNDIDWERNDQTIRIVDFLVR